MDRLSIYTSQLIAALLISLACITSANAQTYQSTPVTVSTEKVRNNGKVFYSHIVLEKQTIYSICKAYETPAEEIYRYNPALHESGLKKGMILLIPVKETEEVKQTTPEAVTKANPKTETTKEVSAELKLEAKKPEEKVHVRKWYEEIEDIAAKYGVTVSDIMTRNNLKDKKLSNRQKLIIPESGKSAPEAVEMTEDTLQEDTNTSEVTPAEADSISVMTPACDSTSAVQADTLLLYPKEKVDVTLMLPLKASSGGSKNTMDFYSGVLMALRDLGDEGVRTDVHVYDISAGGDKVTAEDIDSTDLIIGPVSSGEVNRYLSMIPEGTAMISPLDPRVEKMARNHKEIVQVPTPHEYQYKDLVNWLKEDLTPVDTVIFFTEKDFASSVGKQLKEIVDSAHIAYNSFSYTILEGRDITEPLTSIMTATGVNRVIIGSDNEAFVNDVIRNLNLLVYNKLNIVLYGTSKIRSFETIEAENFHNTSMKVSLGYHIDYDNALVKNFLLKYRALFNTEPTQYAYQGYDIARYFISLCFRYGNRWPEMLEQSEMEMLQSSFRFDTIEEGGHINTGVRRIAYGKDWIVEKVR